jgi:hypothetical protein
MVLNGAPLELAERVAERGTLLFEKDAPARVRWQAPTRKVYFDEKPAPNGHIGSLWRRYAARSAAITARSGSS